MTGHWGLAHAYYCPVVRPADTMMRVGCDAAGIESAACAVRDGRTVAFPTDTVYGIGCDPHNAAAIAAVCAAKSRDPSKPMPILCASAESAWEIASPDALARRLADAFWPGALTMVLPLADLGLRDTMGLHDGTVAVRVPSSRCALALLEACGPLVGTSANVAGLTPATSPDSIGPHGVDLLVDGGVVGDGPVPSTVIRLEGSRPPTVLREGAVRTVELEAHWT